MAGMTLGQRIRQARTAARMTQDDAAYWCECARANISDIERGSHEPSFATLRKLADTYGISVSELIGEQPRSEPGMNARERRAVDVLLDAMRGNV